jgi:hypothetical protein
MTTLVCACSCLLMVSFCVVGWPESSTIVFIDFGLHEECIYLFMHVCYACAIFKSNIKFINILIES